jgi:phage baseplate assembly protein W
MTLPDGSHLTFPFGIGPDGRTARISSLETHVRDELVQLILTNLGERLFLSEFGGGVRRLVFEGVHETTAAMTKAMLTQAITRWLGHRITLEELKVEVENETIWVEIRYRIAGSDESRVMKFAHEGEAP